MKKGWEVKRLDEVYDVRDGTHESPKFHATGFPFVTSKNLKNGELNFDKIQYISEKDYNEYNKRSKVDKGDILFAMIGTLGNPVVVDIEPNFAIKNVALIKVPKNQSNYFLNYYLSSPSVVEKIYSNARGTTQKFVGLGNLRKFEIPLPLLSEQQRIVSVLDEAFASIAQAKSNAERNLVNARELFETYLESLFTNPHKGWEEKTLAEIIDSNVIGLVKNSREQGVDKEYKYVKMNNITPSNNFDFSKYTCVDATKDEVEKYSLADGDFLFNTRNSKELVGKTCIYTSVDDNPVLFNNNIMRIRFTKTINSSFINYQFSTKLLQEKLNLMKSGTTNVSAIYYKNLQYLPLLIPPLAEQRAIVGRLEALSAETGRLEEIYQQKVESLEELKKSVLAKAFEGGL